MSLRRTVTHETPVSDRVTTTEVQNSFDDQIRNYRQNERRRYNWQQGIQRLNRRLRNQPYNRTLEMEVDPQETLRLSMRERARIVPAEVLYHSRRDDTQHRVYVHRSEEAILCTDESQVDRSFIQTESMERLQRSNYSFIHIGILQVRIQILHRQHQGTMALVVFRDNRWTGDQSIFATMEIDLTNGSQLVYAIPDTMMTVADFCRNIQISIITKGYENWQNGEANLLITRGMVGRLSNTSNVGFAYSIQGVTDYLTSHGVRALQGKDYNTKEFQGQNWTIKAPKVNILPVQPSHMESRNLLGGSVSLRFGSYEPASTSAPPKFNQNDEEIDSDEESVQERIAVLIGEEDTHDQYNPWCMCSQCDDEAFYNKYGDTKEVTKKKEKGWDTLGEPSGKFDFHVKYTAPASSSIKIE